MLNKSHRTSHQYSTAGELKEALLCYMSITFDKHRPIFKILSQGNSHGYEK